jgi:hypothetical protein
MSDGTPIEAIETGNVSEAADSHHMQAILETINASGADIANGPVASPPPQMLPQQPPMYNPLPPPPQHRQYIEEDKPRAPKKNIWSSMFDRLRDVFAVSSIFFLLSLPVLHTFAARYAAWAFAIGGQLSWFGLAVFSLVAGVAFGIYRAGSDILGL